MVGDEIRQVKEGRYVGPGSSLQELWFCEMGAIGGGLSREGAEFDLGFNRIPLAAGGE